MRFTRWMACGSFEPQNGAIAPLVQRSAAAYATTLNAINTPRQNPAGDNPEITPGPIAEQRDSGIGGITGCEEQIECCNENQEEPEARRRGAQRAAQQHRAAAHHHVGDAAGGWYPAAIAAAGREVARREHHRLAADCQGRYAV